MPPDLERYEAAIRALIADVQALRDDPDDFDEKLIEIERKLGGLLPPANGTFNIDLTDLFKR
jgi:hypothetical protein